MISLITTVLNEKNNLAEWLGGILSQSKLPDEIVIVDAGSKDGTWEILLEKSRQNNLIKIWQYPGNISVGRNFAITKARGEIVVVTDAGCIYDNNWLKKLLEPILSGQSSFVATGFGPWLKPNDNLTVRLLAAATTPALSEFKKDWLPSSRSVAFKKEIWQTVGGYPEWIPLCEDVVFDLEVRKVGIVADYIREALVLWRPRNTLIKYFKQLFGYTKSDGHGKLWFSRQMVRYVVYSVSLFLLYLTVKFSGAFLIILLAGMSVYMKKFWLRWVEFSKLLPLSKRILGFILLPFIVMLGDVAKMFGWPVGVYDRKIGKIKYEP